MNKNITCTSDAIPMYDNITDSWYYLDVGTNNIYKFNVEDSSATLVTLPSGFNATYKFVMDGYIIGINEVSIYAYNLATKSLITYIGTYPSGVSSFVPASKITGTCIAQNPNTGVYQLTGYSNSGSYFVQLEFKINESSISNYKVTRLSPSNFKPYGYSYPAIKYYEFLWCYTYFDNEINNFVSYVINNKSSVSTPTYNYLYIIVGTTITIAGSNYTKHVGSFSGGVIDNDTEYIIFSRLNNNTYMNKAPKSSPTNVSVATGVWWISYGPSTITISDGEYLYGQYYHTATNSRLYKIGIDRLGILPESMDECTVLVPGYTSPTTAYSCYPVAFKNSKGTFYS